MAALDELDRTTHWMMVIAVSTLVIGALIMTLMPGMLWNDDKEKSKAQHKLTTNASKRHDNSAEEDTGSIDDEPWFPELTIMDWKEAGQLPGCPWSFDDCSSVQEVVRSIWREPTNQGLQQALAALMARVKNVKVAKVHYKFNGQTFFAVIYCLTSGAELFGGAPLEQSVGVELSYENEPGLRRRRGGNQQTKADPEHEVALPCLAPFYRIHDGFGVLLSTKHLPLVMTNTADSIQGSCFYVYPVRGTDALSIRPQLLKFARVDKTCSACADYQLDNPYVVFAEQNGEITDDDEPPLDFVADTVCNITGQRVVPNAAGQYGYGDFC